jgi:RimJ/RimL family protein N-acetyltransferase
MPCPYWPLFELTLSTPRLLLRPPTDNDFPGLLDAIDAGIHDPDVTPFSVPWTDADPTVRRREAVQFWWRQRAGWKPDDWHLPFAVFHDDRPVGIQGVFATRFSILREVSTGSWLTRSAQGHGLGKEMRAAVLQLAFEGLGAQVARSGAFADNVASLAVSKAIGYRPNGWSREAPRGTPKMLVNFELTRDEWVARRDALPRAGIAGLHACLDMFGATQPDES